MTTAAVVPAGHKVPLLLIKTNSHRHTLRQTHPFKIESMVAIPLASRVLLSIQLRQPPHYQPCPSASIITAKRGDFSAIPRADAFQFGFPYAST
jgi:hypothetical protein